MGSPTHHEQATADNDGERAGIYLAALAAFTVPILIITAVFLTRSETDRPIETLEPATQSGLDRLEVEAAELTIEEATTEADTDIAPDPPSSEGMSTPSDEATDDVVAEALSDAPDLAADEVDVTIYNRDADAPNTYSFALRLKSVSATSEIETRHFDISVVDAQGNSVPSLSRFEHETLPVGSSALASVRAEEVGAGPHFLVVRVGNVEVDRLAIVDPGEA